jgi:ABC-type phosphate transport system ATPase subunit
MTLYERVAHFQRAATTQEDERTNEELINTLTPAELLKEISSALEYAPLDFNTKWC